MSALASVWWVLGSIPDITFPIFLVRFRLAITKLLLFLLSLTLVVSQILTTKYSPKLYLIEKFSIMLLAYYCYTASQNTISAKQTCEFNTIGSIPTCNSHFNSHLNSYFQALSLSLVFENTFCAKWSHSYQVSKFGMSMNFYSQKFALRWVWRIELSMVPCIRNL